MKRAELKKHIPKSLDRLTVDMFRTCGQDVLMIAGRANKWYGYTQTKPADPAVHFIWPNGWLTCWMNSGTWTREGLSTVDFGFIDRRYEAVTKFCNKHGGTDPEDFERSLSWEKRNRTIANKQKKIDNFMDTNVPPLPRGFTQKIRRMAKDTRPGKHIDVKMFQRIHEDGVVERMFKATKQRDGSLIIFEFCRAFSGEYGDAWNFWYYGWKMGEYGKRQKFWPTRSGGTSCIPHTFRIYDNFTEEDLTRQQESCLRIMDGLADPSVVLNHLHFCPDLEYVIKSEWKHMAADLCGCSVQGCKEALGKLESLDRNTLNRLKRADAGVKEIEIIRENPKISDEWLNEISRWRSDEKIEDIRGLGRRGLNINHVMTLLSKTGGLKLDNIRTYADYIDMAEQRGEDIHDEIIYRNKRWREFHDRYIEEANRKKDEERKKKLKGKFAGISSDYDRNREIFGWSDGSSCIIIPKSYEDIIDEGSRRHHCVGASDHYMQNMSDRKTWILFLRHEEAPEEPWYTIETDGNRIRQFYAAYDRQPEKEKVEKILDTWMKQVRKNMIRVEKEEAEKAAEQMPA